MESAQTQYDDIPIEECSVEDFAFTPVDDDFIFELLCSEGQADDIESAMLSCAAMMDRAAEDDKDSLDEATIFGFSYANWKHDPRPNVMIFGKYRHPNTHNVLVCGINTNYLKADQLKKLKNAEKKIFSQKTLRQRYWAGRALLPDIFKTYYRNYIDRYISVKKIAQIPTTYTPDLSKDNTLDFNKWRKYVNLSYLQSIERKDRAVVAAKAMRKQLAGNAERKAVFLQKQRDAKKVDKEKKAAVGKALHAVAPEKKAEIKARVLPKKGEGKAQGALTRLAGAEEQSKSSASTKARIAARKAKLANGGKKKKPLKDDFVVRPKTWAMFLAESVI